MVGVNLLENWEGHVILFRDDKTSIRAREGVLPCLFGGIHRIRCSDASRWP
jgi:hypothetical protein